MGQSYKAEMVPQRSQSNGVWVQRMGKGMEGRGLACSPSRVSAPLLCLPSSQARSSRACAGGAGAPGPPAATRQLGVPLLLAQGAFLPAPLPGALPAGPSWLLVNGESRGCREWGWGSRMRGTPCLHKDPICPSRNVPHAFGAAGGAGSSRFCSDPLCERSPRPAGVSG